MYALLSKGPFNDERCEVKEPPPKTLDLPRIIGEAPKATTGEGPSPVADLEHVEYEFVGIDRDCPEPHAIYIYRPSGHPS
jgi:hypothetical protein